MGGRRVSGLPDIDREYLERVTRDLVRISSINPTLVPGAPGERDVAHFTAVTLKALGLKERHELTPPDRLKRTQLGADRPP